MARAATLEAKLLETFAPTHLVVTNESDGHNVPRGSETHFRVLVVAEKFAGVSAVQRHRLVFDALRAELENGLHALAVTARTPAEWQANGHVLPSPPCAGGSGK